MRTGVREAVSVLILGAAFLSVPLGYWAGPPPAEPAPRQVYWLKPEQLPLTDAEVRGLYRRFFDRLVSPS